MQRLTVSLGASALILGISALIFAAADVIHGQHNGDARRFHIHVAEFVSFFGFLSILVLQAFRLMTRKTGLNGWLSSACLSVGAFIVGFVLFALAGGSFHGDGGPIAVSFGLMAYIGMLGIPISIVGFMIARIVRKRRNRLIGG